MRPLQQPPDAPPPSARSPPPGHPSAGMGGSRGKGMGGYPVDGSEGAGAHYPPGAAFWTDGSGTCECGVWVRGGGAGCVSPSIPPRDAPRRDCRHVQAAAARVVNAHGVLGAP
jgi:hypothetical protein